MRIAVLIIGTFALSAAGAAEPAFDFNSHIRPLLQRHCAGCHNPKTAKGGLDLTTRKSILAGGDSGAAAVPGESDRSLMFLKVRDRKMPPKQPLTVEQAELLRRWIARGADWSGGPLTAGATEPTGSPWALAPIVEPAVPDGDADHAIDRFLQREMTRRGVTPLPATDRRTLIRRMSIDLLGLPPTPEDVEAFVADDRPDAIERLADRLLASPQYGERWARHWLDVVRFGESHGYETNALRTNAWPYRDWVIRAFNRDLPLPQFVLKQLAGDAVPDGDPLTRAATGFLVGGTHDIVGNQSPEGKAQQRADDLYDIVSTVGSAFLGLTVNCARCHDHKFDPVSQRDFYALSAVFDGVKHVERPIPGLGEGTKVRSYYVGSFEPAGVTHLLRRGDPMSKGEPVAPGAIASVAPSLRLTDDVPEQQRRIRLAEWIAHPDNPLADRVMVNRVWQHHFGQGLVRTPSDFGVQGDRPSHPELLDWLVTRFRAGGRRLKPLHRLILLSAAYARSSAVPENAAQRLIDADNRLLWHHPRRRVEAEVVRDSLLSVAGTLDTRMGGPGYHLWSYTGYVIVFRPIEELDEQAHRRMVYQFKPRTRQDPTFGVFDCPDATLPAPRRNVSNSAAQALALLNSPFVADQCERFAERLARDAGSDASAQVRRAFALCFGREPSQAELEGAVGLARAHGPAALCRAMVNANEFVFVD